MDLPKNKRNQLHLFVALLTLSQNYQYYQVVDAFNASDDKFLARKNNCGNPWILLPSNHGRASLEDSTSLELLETDFFGLYSVMTTVTPLTVTWVIDRELSGRTQASRCGTLEARQKVFFYQVQNFGQRLPTVRIGTTLVAISFDLVNGFR